MTFTPQHSPETLLLGPAVDVALRRGRISDPAAVRSVRRSRQGESLVLLDATGGQLARVSLQAVRQQAARRRARAERLLHRRTSSGTSLENWRVRLRLRSWNDRALAWALSSGRPAPEPVLEGRKVLLLVVLLLLGLLPGLIYLGLLVRDWLRYGRDLEKLVGQWKSVGRPDPLEAGLAPLE